MRGTDGLYAPVWSPDGHYIVAQLASRRQIILFDVQKGTRATLIDGAADFPVFSPDSQFLYYSRASTGKIGIFRLRLRDRTNEKVADVPFKVVGSFGTWSGLAPDGSVLVLRDRSQTDVYALTLER
jgi:Tol biopolymer transport system component